MASGIDMSARLITLAINIALMGLILIEEIPASPDKHGSGSGGRAAVASVAAAIAAGTASATDISSAVIHGALVHGFGLVMLYGGLGVWVLAIASFVVSARDAEQTVAQTCHPGQRQ